MAVYLDYLADHEPLNVFYLILFINLIFVCDWDCYV